MFAVLKSVFAVHDLLADDCNPFVSKGSVLHTCHDLECRWRDEESIGELAIEWADKFLFRDTCILKEVLTASPGGKHFYYLTTWR